AHPGERAAATGRGPGRPGGPGPREPPGPRIDPDGRRRRMTPDSHGSGGDMDEVATMHKVLEMTGQVVDHIEPSQLDNPTPCTEWTVRDVLNHVTGGATMFGLCVRDGAVPDEKFGELMTGDNLGSDFKSSFHRATDAAEESFAIPGAMERIVKLPFGEMPAGMA